MVAVNVNKYDLNRIALMHFWLHGLFPILVSFYKEWEVFIV